MPTKEFNTDVVYEVLAQTSIKYNPLKIQYQVTRDDWPLFGKDTHVYVVEVTGSGNINSQAPMPLADNADDYYGYTEIDADADFVQIYECKSSDVRTDLAGFDKGDILMTLYAHDSQERAMIHRLFDEDILSDAAEYMQGNLEEHMREHGLANGSYCDEDFV